ncbi:pseudaminic acid cytidylyltransferase [Christiangramia sp. LLG6405-1]|uniref:pseudaminic acid cytidylyltransferase n=1 Tax=Christiangramia sp. LLG6405-1 TaxID=3160832 RepID=UPI0038705700
MTKNLCIIPARGGSKRIPRKNIKSFLGKPIISYSIEAALETGIFEEVMVSTEDEEIADVAKNYGAKVPFFRSYKNADDYATTVDVLLEVIQQYDKLDRSFDNICCIYPTAPFATKEKLEQAYRKLDSKNFDAIFPVLEYSYPIQRALKLKESKISLFYPENETKRSQDFENSYHDSGQFYFLKTNRFLKNRTVFTKNSGAIILSELEAQDIDNEIDWKLAEMKYELL